MTIRDLHTRHKPGSLSLQRATAGSRTAPAPVDSSADAWLEPTLADFISLATSLCDMPMGMISQLHADIGLHHPVISVVNGQGDLRNQWWRFPGQNGVARTIVDFALCQYAATRPRELTELTDLQAHPRFAVSALANGNPRVRFYAAVSLVSSNGDVLGTLCVMDTRPRMLSATQRDALLKLGRQLEALLNPARPEAIPLLNEKGIRIGAEERRGLALVELIDRIPMKALPAAGGCDPTVVLTLDLETLLGGLKPVVLDTGHRISPGLARRLAAAHGVIPAVLGTNSEVLDLGRKARLASKKQRLALCLQQHGVCAEEHCDTPITWGQAAHITAWKHGGPTNLANLVIPCRKHHRMADHPDYHLTRLGPGRIRITRRTRT